MSGNVFFFSLPFWLQYRHHIKGQNPKLLLFVEILSPQDERDLEKLEWLLPESANKINFHMIVISHSGPVNPWPAERWCTWFSVGKGTSETSLVLAQQMGTLHDIIPETEMRILYRSRSTFDVSHVFQAWGRKTIPTDPEYWDIDLLLLHHRDLNLSEKATFLRGLLHNRREILNKQGTPPDLSHFFDDLRQLLGSKVKHLTPQKVRNIDNYFLQHKQRLTVSA